MIKIVKTKFKDCLILEPHYFSDARGAFYESWRSEDYKNIGIIESFKQDNISISKKNVLRGLHIQKNQGQLIWVSFGKIFDVGVDMRPESETYKQYFSIELSAESPKQIYMPPGFAHGFCVLSDIAVVNYKCTEYYDTECESGILWSDPSVNIEWPVQLPILSERDQSFYCIDELPK